MAQSNRQLIDALRETTVRLARGARYEWGHMGRCNCRHLLQTITAKSDHELVESIDVSWTNGVNMRKITVRAPGKR